MVTWKIGRVFPPAVASELSEDDFSDIRFWKFKAAANNSQQLPVIATRAFGYNQIGDDIEKCFDFD